MSNHTESAGRLSYIVKELERIAQEKKELGEESKELFAGAKSAGFEPKALREVLRRRKKARGERIDFDTLVGSYEETLEEFI